MNIIHAITRAFSWSTPKVTKQRHLLLLPPELLDMIFRTFLDFECRSNLIGTCRKFQVFDRYNPLLGRLFNAKLHQKIVVNETTSKEIVCARDTWREKQKPNPLSTFVLDRAGNLLVTGEHGDYNDDVRVTVWDLKNHSHMRLPSFFGKSISRLILNPANNQVIASSVRTRECAVYDLAVYHLAASESQDKSELHTYLPSSRYGFTHCNGTTLFCGNDEGPVRMSAMQDLEKSESLAKDEHQAHWSDIEWIDDNSSIDRIFSLSSQRSLRIWDAKTKTCIKELRASQACYDPKHNWLIGGESTQIHIWDGTTGEEIVQYKDPEFKAEHTSIKALTFDSNTKTVVAAFQEEVKGPQVYVSLELKIVVWDPVKNKVLKSFPAIHPKSQLFYLISTIQYDPKNNMILTSGPGGCAFWSSSRGRLIRAFDNNLVKVQWDRENHRVFILSETSLGSTEMAIYDYSRPQAK